MSKRNSKLAEEELEARVPTHLRKILRAVPKTKALWDDLTPIARRDFITWIESAKQAETQRRRIEGVPNMLTEGKRRPCCYALVPMNLYKALGESSKAKAQWKSLTPTEKRDFVSWVDSAKDLDMQTLRIVKASAMLEAGKRHP